MSCFECNQGDFFPGLFLKGKLIREREAELVHTTLYCNVLMVVHSCPRHQEFLPKTRNPDQKSSLKTIVNLTSFLAVFGVSKYSFPILSGLKGLLRNHLSVRAYTSVADLQLLLPQKVEKHRNFSCLLKPSGSTSVGGAVAAGPRQSCSGHLQSILWRKTKTKEAS